MSCHVVQQLQAMNTEWYANTYTFDFLSVTGLQAKTTHPTRATTNSTQLTIIPPSKPDDKLLRSGVC